MTIENTNEDLTAIEDSDSDPWSGYPDSPWVIDGYSMDDAICNHLLQLESRYDGVRFVSGKEALEHLLAELRSRAFDAKPASPTLKSDNIKLTNGDS